jgi:hypothetical protein
VPARSVRRALVVNVSLYGVTKRLFLYCYYPDEVNKKILDIYFPQFNEKSKVHLQLAELSQQTHEKAQAYMKAYPPQQQLSAIHLGRLRVEIKKHLREEMKEMDELVRGVIG